MGGWMNKMLNNSYSFPARGLRNLYLSGWKFWYTLTTIVKKENGKTLFIMSSASLLWVELRVWGILQKSS